MSLSFEFEVTKVWKITDDIFHVIGILKSGKVMPPCAAVLPGEQGQTIQIETMVIAKSISGDPREITVSISKPTFDYSQLEGKVISDQKDCL